MAKKEIKKEIKKEAVVVSRKVGHYSFIIGIILALALGLFSDNLSVTTTLWIMFFMVVFGLIVGLLNIQHKEMTEFLVASIALMVIYPAITPISALLSKLIFGAGAFLQQMFAYMVIFIVPAVLIVAVKVIVELAEKR